MIAALSATSLRRRSELGCRSSMAFGELPLFDLTKPGLNVNRAAVGERIVLSAIVIDIAQDRQLNEIDVAEREGVFDRSLETPMNRPVSTATLGASMM